MNLKSINKALQSKYPGVELVKGKGYFYFVGDNLSTQFSTSVMVNNISALSLEEWIREIDEMIIDRSF